MLHCPAILLFELLEARRIGVVAGGSDMMAEMSSEAMRSRLPARSRPLFPAAPPTRGESPH
jgi:hypothetical protein